MRAFLVYEVKASLMSVWIFSILKLF